MSLTEILEELPKLSPQDVEAVYQRAEEILHHQPASPGLLAAIDEALATPEDQDTPAEEVRGMIKEWAYSK